MIWSLAFRSMVSPLSTSASSRRATWAPIRLAGRYFAPDRGGALPRCGVSGREILEQAAADLRFGSPAAQGQDGQHRQGQHGRRAGRAATP